MAYYFNRNDDIKQEEEYEEEVENENEDEVEMIWIDRDNNEVDPLALPIKQEIFETPRVGVVKNLVPVLSNTFNPLINVKTEYLPHQTSSSLHLNEFNNLRMKPDPENYGYNLNDDCPSPPSPSPSFFELSGSDDEAVVQKSPDSHDIRIIDLVPELGEYINKDNQRQVKTSQPNQTAKTSQIEISLIPFCKIRPETQVSTSHPSTTTKRSQQDVSLTPLYRIRPNENETNNYKEKTQVRECKIILHKLPDSLVEQCNIPLREERRKTSEPPEPEKFANNIKYEYSHPSAFVKYECPSLSPPNSIYEVYSSGEENDETLVQEENSTLAEYKLQTDQELSSTYENYFATDITLLSKNECTLFHCNVCIRSFKRRYDIEKHMKSTKHKIEKDKQIDLKKKSEPITHIAEQKGDSEFVCSLGEIYSENRVIPDKERKMITESNSMESVKYTQIEYQGGILYTCNYCDYSTKRHFGMERHCKSKKHNHLLESNVCRSDSTKHKKTKNSIGDTSTDFKTNVNTCDICGFKAPGALNMTKHKVRFHSKSFTNKKITRKKIFNCNLCDYTSEFLSNLKRHKLNDHTILTSFTCQICKTSFKDIDKFNSHKLNHSNKGNEVGVQENPSLHSNKTSYKCPTCAVVFKDYSRFEEHNKSFHVKENVFFCDLCEYKSTYSENLNQHKIKHHSVVNVYTCQGCKTSFKSGPKFKAHKCINLKETFCCDICESKFKSQSILNKHRLTHSKLHKCSICKESFEDYNKFANHNSLHLKSKIYDCDDCDFKTAFNFSLMRHKLSFHSGKKIYKCVTCHIIVKGYDKLLEHRLIHYKKRKFSCDICKYTCNSLYILHNHKSKYHSTQFGHVCSVCNVSFEDFYKLRIHKTTHVEGLLYNCDHCEYKSNVLYNIERHKINAHSNKKSYRCRHCHACITGYVQFLQHKTTHLKNKFNCDICKYTSSVGSSLKRHKEKYHSAPMTYTCETCKASFDNVTKYRIHKTVHLKGKTFGCNLCEYKTVFRSNVKPHMKRHHSNIMFKCDTCNANFSNFQTFKKHKSTHVKTKSIESSVVTSSASSVDNKVSQFESTNSCEKEMRCNFCLYTTTNMSHFLRHQHTSHFKKLLSCDKCEYTTKIATLLRKHKIKIHAGKSKKFPIKVHKCNICKFTTIHEASLLRHKTEVHSINMQLYTCHICKVTFKRNYSLKLHLKLHRNEVLNKCKNGNNSKKESNETFDCKFCKTIFSDCRNLNRHIKSCYVYLDSIKTEPTASKQNITDSNISYIEPIRRKGKSKRSENIKNFVCKFCFNTYTRKHDLKRHMVVHSGQEPYKCDKCFYKSYDECDLKRHKTRLHPEEENITIKNTEAIEENKSTPLKTIKSLNTVKDLNMKSKSGQKMFNCNFCKAVFKTFQQFRNHSRYHLGYNRKPELKNTNKNTTKMCSIAKSIKYKFLCKICSHHCKSQSSLDEHMSLHFDGKPYKCNKCTFMTAYRSILSKHKQTHKKSIPVEENNILGLKNFGTNVVKERTEKFDCCVCNAIFKTQGSLIKHMKHHFPDVATDLNDINTNENLDTVFDMENGNTDNENMSKITKGRSKNTKQDKSITRKKFKKCKICFRNFFNNSDLQKHLIIHSGIKPFTCDKCNYVSNYYYNLNRHKQNRHGKRTTSNLENIVQNTDSSSEIIEKNKGMEIKSVTFDCSYCNIIFNTYDSFMEHMKYHVPNNSYILNNTEENNITKQNIKTDVSLNILPVIQHSKVNTSKFSCNTCLRNFSRKQSLDKHMILHGREKPFACDKCNYRTNYSGNLKKHKQRKHVTKKIKLTQSLESGVDNNIECKLPLNCSVCKIIFNSSVGLMEHMKYHDSDNNTVVKKNKNMNVSDESSVNKDLILNTESIIQYSKHVKTTKINSEVHCNICLRTYSSLHSLRRHKFLHTGTFASDKCHCRSNHHTNLRRHKERVHLISIESTIKPSSENVEENKISSLKAIGDNHISDKQKNINSDLSINARSYIQHRNIKHTGKKLTFKCMYCSQNYSSQYSLDRHKLRHTGEKPHACEKCTFRTYDKSILKKHKIKHHSRRVNISIHKPSIENSSIPNSIPFVESISVIQTLKSIDENISAPSSKSIEENISIPSSVLVEENTSILSSKLVVENISISGSKSVSDNMSTPGSKLVEEDASLLNSKLVVENISMPSSKSVAENISTPGSKLVEENTSILCSKSVEENISIPSSVFVENISIPNSKSVAENISTPGSKLVEENTSILCSKSVEENISIPSSVLVENISIPNSKSVAENISTPGSKLVEENTSILNSKLVVENISIPNSKSIIENIIVQSFKSDEENISIPISKTIFHNTSVTQSTDTAL